MVKRGANVVAVEPQADLAANLARRFPMTTVLQVAVSDRAGQASLNLATEHTSIASLDRTWAPQGRSLTWYDSQPVNVITIEDLILRFGVPRLLKTDTEGLDHQVLRTLNRPVEHILFEVQGGRLHDAEAALQHLDSLGCYEYQLSERNSWVFSSASSAGPTLDDLAIWESPPGEMSMRACSTGNGQSRSLMCAIIAGRFAGQQTPTLWSSG